MIKLLGTGLAMAMLTAAAPAPEDWTPTLAQVAVAERTMQLPKRAGGLGSFRRHYAGVVIDGRRVLRGTFISGRAGVVIVANVAKLPVIFDGGCGIVEVWHDMTTARSESNCHGIA